MYIILVFSIATSTLFWRPTPAVACVVSAQATFAWSYVCLVYKTKNICISLHLLLVKVSTLYWRRYAFKQRQVYYMLYISYTQTPIHS